MKHNNQNPVLNNENSDAKSTGAPAVSKNSSENTNINSKIDASKIYPEAKIDPVLNSQSQDVSALQDQALAVQVVKNQTKETNRPVSLRAKSVLIVAIVLLLGALYQLLLEGVIIYKEWGTLINKITEAETLLFFAIVMTSIAEFIIAIYLFFGKDNYRISFFIKIFMIFQAFAFLRSLTNIYSAVISGALLLVCVYAYIKVKNLNYL